MQRDVDATFIVVGQTYTSKHEDDDIKENAMGGAVARSGEMKMFQVCYIMTSILRF
jgi:hypothetical protein